MKLGFSDMWGYDEYQFNPHDNYFTDLFSGFNLEITNDNPDLLIYSVFGNDYKKYDCKKIFFTGENFSKERIPDHYNSADVVLSHYDDSEKEILLPLWVIFLNWFNKPQPRPLPSNPTYLVDFDLIQNNRERFITNPRNFCAFINNSYVQDRVEMLEALNTQSHEKEYQSVHSLGKLYNNMGGALRGSEKDKVDALKRYKFTIAFENSYHSGYNTEKIIQPFEAGCIPIYRGGERVLKYFNEKAFIYSTNLSIAETKDRVFDIFENREKYEAMLLEKPLILENIMSDFAPSVVLEKIKNILS